MMKSTNTGSRDSAIRGLRQYAADLRATMERLRADLSAVERSIRLLEGAPTGEGPLSERGAEAYAHLKPQGAVEKYMREHPGEKIKPTDLAKKLVHLGLPKSSKAFVAAITGALMRAAAKGIVRQGKNDRGRNVYWCPTEDGHGGQQP